MEGARRRWLVDSALTLEKAMTQETAAPPAASIESEDLNRSEREVLDLIRARYSLLYIVSSEEQRVEESLHRLGLDGGGQGQRHDEQCRPQGGLCDCARDS